jgi:acetoacetyl-CoA synthetase
VADRFFAVAAMPRTLTGKKCEVPVKRILSGVNPDVALSKEALQNRDALAPFVELANR